MKLKPVPADTVVLTPTEKEAKELLSILYENGYEWHNGDNLSRYIYYDNAYEISRKRVINISNPQPGAITLAEFKERFLIEEDKPQPKFKVGDKVRVLYSRDHQGKISMIESVIQTTTGISPYCYALSGILGTFFEICLAPYTGPETKPTEDMETKDETKELNLCQLLKGREGEAFYSPQHGWVELVEVDQQLHPNTVATTIPGARDLAYYLPSGKYLKSDSSACVGLFPTRALYEQYPLDARKAWQEEQKRHKVHVFINGLSTPDVEFDKVISFHTPADRDKAISEFKAIIEKYSKQWKFNTK